LGKLGKEGGLARAGFADDKSDLSLGLPRPVQERGKLLQLRLAGYELLLGHGAPPLDQSVLERDRDGFAYVLRCGCAMVYTPL
jgi:hypothetical protein